MNANDCGFPSLTYNNVNTNGLILESPGYGDLGYKYLPDTDCTYTFRKDPSYTFPQFILALRFLSSVKFDVPGKFPECKTDYLEITIGENNSKKIKFCGNEVPFPIYSQDGVIRVRTSAHSASEGGKFRLRVFVKPSNFGDACPFLQSFGSHGVIISPTYPISYKNVTCDHRITVTSQKNVNLYFFDINLQSNVIPCDVENNNKDFVEVRGTPYITTPFEEAQIIGQRKCGDITGLYTLVGVRYDYVFVRFHSSTGSNNRGMYVAYSLYDKPKSSPKSENNALPMLWIGIICGIIILLIVVWMVIYRALNVKKQQRAVVPQTSSEETDGYASYIPTPYSPARNNTFPTAPPPPFPMSVPDYNPADLFAAKTIALPPEVTDENLSSTLFPQKKNDDLVSGLSPGYVTSQYESRTAGVVT